MKSPDFACILVPDLPLQALLRLKPEGSQGPIAVVEGKGPCASISHVAFAPGVCPGMTLAKARSIVPDLVARPVGKGVVLAAHEALLDLALACSPCVEPFGLGVVVLEVSLASLRSLFSRMGSKVQNPPLSLSNLPIHLASACKELGLSACVALASGPRIALVAARGLALSFTYGKSKWICIPRGDEAKAIAPLPIEALEPSKELLETLKGLGIRTVGDFARLDRRSLGLRLGPEALSLHYLACGEDRTCLEPIKRQEAVREEVELEYTLDNAEGLLFLVQAGLERATRRLMCRGEVPSSLCLELHCDGEKSHKVEVSLPVPTGDLRGLITLVRLRLEALSLGSPVMGFTLEVKGAKATKTQGDLFAPTTLGQSEWGGLIARLSAIAGEDRVGHPALRDCHCRDPSLIRPMGPPPPKRASEIRPRPPILALRRLPQDPKVEVIIEGGRPAWILDGGRRLRVLRTLGPWYCATGWWDEGGEDGAFYDVEVDGGAVFRLWQDFEKGRWRVEGVYD